MRLRGGPQEGRVQGWRNREPEARLFDMPNWVRRGAETRETGHRREPGYRWAADPSGKPSNHSIGNSEQSDLVQSQMKTDEKRLEACRATVLMA